MVWFKVDDKFHSSIEVMSIPPNKRAASIGLWCLAGAWSSDQLKDGYVPTTMLKTWGGSEELAANLVAAKLWTRVGKTGYRFRNWAKWQVMRAQVETTREQERVRKASWRESKAQKSQQTSTDVPPMSPLSRPDPTRPDPTRVKGLERSGGVGTTGPYCTRHPGGTDDACGPCRTARIVFESTQAEAKAASTVKAVTATPRRYVSGDGHEHRVSPGGDHCELCEERIT